MYWFAILLLLMLASVLHATEKFEIIQSLQEIDEKLPDSQKSSNRYQTWLFLDLDEVTLLQGERHYIDPASLRDTNLPYLIQKWHAEGIRIFFLTARSYENIAPSLRQLESIGIDLKTIGFNGDMPPLQGLEFYQEGVISSNNDFAQKGPILIKFLEEAKKFYNQFPNFIAFVDDMDSALKSVDQALNDAKIPHKVLSYPIDLAPVKKEKILPEPFLGPTLGNEDLQRLFPQQLDMLVYEGENLRGGTGGVYILRDPGTGRKYTLKTNQHTDRIKEEILADALYRALGVPVPAFKVFWKLPAKLRQQLAFNNDSGPYRLSQFIETNKNAPTQERIIQIQRHFIVDAFLSNWDVGTNKGLDNTILNTNSELLRIDNGGSLRYRASEAKKEPSETWDPYWVTEIDTLRNSSINPDAASIYGLIPEDEIRRQVTELLTNFPTAQKILRTIGNSLKIKDIGALEYRLVSRIRDLQVRFHRPIPPLAAKFEAAIPNKTSASIFIYKTINGTPHVLLGRRIGTGVWGNLGGGSDPGEPTLAHTATREVQEESLNSIYFEPQKILNAPSHDLLTASSTKGFLRHRMYFMPYEGYVNLEALKLENPEYTDFTWVSIKDLQSSLEGKDRVKKLASESSTDLELTIEIGKEKLPLHSPFYRMLVQGPVRAQLQNLTDQRKLFQQHTQGWSQKELQEPIDKTGYKIKWISNEVYQIGDQVFFAPTSMIEESEELAKVVVKRSSVLADIKNKRINGLKQPNSPFLENLPYTQSQAFLKNQLGDTYKEDASTWENVVSYLTKYKDTAEYDEAFLARLQPILQKEEKYQQRYLTFYSAADAEIGFLTDVMSEVKKILEHKNPKGFKVLRGIDKYFEFAHVLDFLTYYENSRTPGKNLDYSNGYPDRAISISPVFFNLKAGKKESAYYFFLQRQSINPPPLEKILVKFFKQFGLKINAERYLNIYRKYCENKQTALFQIFIDPAITDKLVYNSDDKGEVTTFLNNQDKGPTSSLIKLRRNPAAQPIDVVSSAQLKLYLDPRIAQDPNRVHIEMYWRTPMDKNEEKSFKEEIREAVEADLSRLLSRKIRKEGDTYRTSSATPGGQKSSLERMYEFTHEDQLGPIEYTNGDFYRSSKTTTINNLKTKKIELNPSFEVFLSENALERNNYMRFIIQALAERPQKMPLSDAEIKKIILKIQKTVPVHRYKAVVQTIEAIGPQDLVYAIEHKRLLEKLPFLHESDLDYIYTLFKDASFLRKMEAVSQFSKVAEKDYNKVRHIERIINVFKNSLTTTKLLALTACVGNFTKIDKNLVNLMKSLKTNNDPERLDFLESYLSINDEALLPLKDWLLHASNNPGTLTILKELSQIPEKITQTLLASLIITMKESPEKAFLLINSIRRISPSYIVLTYALPYLPYCSPHEVGSLLTFMEGLKEEQCMIIAQASEGLKQLPISDLIPILQEVIATLYDKKRENIITLMNGGYTKGMNRHDIKELINLLNSPSYEEQKLRDIMVQPGALELIEKIQPFKRISILKDIGPFLKHLNDDELLPFWRAYIHIKAKNNTSLVGKFLGSLSKYWYGSVLIALDRLTPEYQEIIIKYYQELKIKAPWISDEENVLLYFAAIPFQYWEKVAPILQEFTVLGSQNKDIRQSLRALCYIASHPEGSEDYLTKLIAKIDDALKTGQAYTLLRLLDKSYYEVGKPVDFPW